MVILLASILIGVNSIKIDGLMVRHNISFPSINKKGIGFHKKKKKSKKKQNKKGIDGTKIGTLTHIPFCKLKS